VEGYLFEKPMIHLFRRADFYRSHHFPGGDDNAAEDSSSAQPGGRHGFGCLTAEGRLRWPGVEVVVLLGAHIMLMRA